MKTLHIAYTDQKRILAIGRPSTIPCLLRNDERIVNNWYYTQPQELESFLKEYPEKEEDILEAFSYWVMQKLMGLEEIQNHYGKIKRELQNFSKKLFKSLRAIAGRIAKQVKQIIKPQAVYKEQRQEKKIYQYLTSKPIKIKTIKDEALE